MAEPIDVVEMLIRDHQALDRLMVNLDRETRPAELYRLYLEMAGEVAVHEAAEENIVFPALLQAVGRDADDLLGQHEEINELIDDMRRLDPGGPGFEKRAAALLLEVREHMAEEEEGIFPQLREAFTPAQLVELGQRTTAARSASGP